MLSLVHEKYEDKSRQNYDHGGDKMMIGDCAKVSNQRV